MTSAISSAAKQVAGTSGPHRRRVQPEHRRGAGQGRARQQVRGRESDRQRAGRLPGLGRHQPAAPRARAVQVPRADPGRIRRSRAAPLLRARQDLRGLQGRHPARAGSGRVRLRHPASAEGRIHRGRRPEHRPLFGAPAARRRRRHHAVQFSRHDPAVEVRARDRVRQHLHPQAVRARPVGADPHRRAVRQGRTARRRAQRRQRRQGSGRHAAHRCARQGDRLRRLVRHRAVHLFDRHGARKARAMLRRRQEPHDRDAGCRHRPGGRCADRRRLRLGRRALHGDLGRGAGRQEDRRHSGREADPAGREPEGRAVRPTRRRTTARWSPRRTCRRCATMSMSA